VLPGRCNITVCIDIPVATELAAPLAENCIWRQVRGSGAEISGSDGPATATEKVSGYAYKSTSIKDGVNQFNLQQEHDEGSGIACFQALVDFLCSLMSSNDDGTIIGAKQKLSRQPEESYLKFVMLYAKKYFQRSLGMLILLSWLVEPSSLLKKLRYACVQAYHQLI